jgi:hypothetical protein
MASQKTVTYTSMSVRDFLENFAGRLGIGHDDCYRPEKRYKIAECNRDYVWGDDLKESFIMSVLDKDAVPSVVICNGELIDAGNRATTLWLYANDKFAVDGVTFNNLSRDRYGNWCACHMPMTIIENATEDEKAEYYEKYNKGIVLTFGQKLDNRKNRPLVATACAMIGNGSFPLRDLQDAVWTPRFVRTKGRSELAFAYRILVASMLGPQHFHSNFGTHSRIILDPDLVPSLDNLRRIYETLHAADPSGLIAPALKKKCFKLFIGGVLFDYHRMPFSEFHEKWLRFFQDAYNRMPPDDLKSVCKAASRIRAIRRNREFGDYPGAMSEVVAKYLSTGAIPHMVMEDDDDDDDSTD